MPQLGTPQPATPQLAMPRLALARNPRRVGVAMAMAAAIVVGLTSFAWACVTADGPYVDPLFMRKAPVAQDVVVQGGHWASTQPVTLDWRTSSSVVAAPLGSATVTDSGTFSSVVKVPQFAPGYYYIAVSQNGVTRSVPFEVAIASNPEAATPVVAEAASGQQWSGLRAGSNTGGLADVSQSSSTSPFGSSMMVALVIGAGVVALAACVVVERRRPVRARQRS